MRLGATPCDGAGVDAEALVARLVAEAVTAVLADPSVRRLLGVGKREEQERLARVWAEHGP